MNKNDYLVKAFESIGKVLDLKETEILLLKHEVDNLRKQIQELKSKNAAS